MMDKNDYFPGTDALISCELVHAEDPAFPEPECGLRAETANGSAQGGPGQDATGELPVSEDLNKDVDDFLSTMDLKIRQRKFRFSVLWNDRIRRVLLLGMNLLLISLAGLFSFRSVRPVRVQNITLDLAWRYRTLAAVFSSAAVIDINDDGKNDIIISSSDGKLYALDGRSGRRIFFFETEHPIVASPVLQSRNKGGKAVILAGGEGKIYALGPDQRCLWSTIRQDFSSSVISTPVLLNINQDGIDDVVVAAEDGKLYAFDGDRGWLIWKSRSTRGRFFSTPAAARINRDAIRDLIVGSPDGLVYGLDGKTGSKIWETKVDGPVNSSPVSAGKERFFIGDEQGNLYEMSAATGRILSRTDLGAPVVSTPAVLKGSSGKFLVLPLGDGTVRCLDAKDLKTVWNYRTGYQDAFTSSPAAYDLNADGRDDIITASRNGFVYVLDGRTGKDLVNPYFTGNSVSSSPILADVNGDGSLDIIFGSENGNVEVLSIRTVPDRIVRKNQIVLGSFLNRNETIH